MHDFRIPEVPPLLDKKSYYILTGLVVLPTSIILGSLGVPVIILTVSAFVGTLALNRLVAKKGWVK